MSNIQQLVRKGRTAAINKRKSPVPDSYPQRKGVSALVINILIQTILSNFSFAQPSISSFTPSAGPVGTAVSITGTNFNTTPTSNIVYFGATKATVTSASPTSLTVVVPNGASFQPISITNLTSGLMGYSLQPFIATYCGDVINSSSFAAKVDFSTGTEPLNITTGDYDGDGKTDIAVVYLNFGFISIFRNTSSNGIISFAPKVDIQASGNFRITTGDFNGDGKLDLAITDSGINTVSIFRNTSTIGTVSFAPKVVFTTGASPLGVSIGDLDGDGKTDIAVANRNSNTVSVLRNTGGGVTISFSPKVDFVTGTQPAEIAISDLDGDGKPDLSITNSGSASVSILRNNGSSGIISFASKVDFVTGSSPWGVSAVDVDGDGKRDLAIANYNNTNTISILRNIGSIGNISFSPKVDFTAGGFPMNTPAFDLDGDSKPDLAVINYSSSTISVLKNTSSLGIISFAPKVDFASGTNPRWGSINDLDGDGKPDLITANINSNTISALRNIMNNPLTSASASANNVCAGTSVILTGSGSNTYSWNGGVINGVAFTPPIGVNNYTVTGTNTNTGCSSTASISITVNTLPVVNANASSSTVCEGSNITLSGSGASTYNWSNGIINGAPFSPQIGVNTYIVTGTNNISGCSNSDTIIVNVNPLPNVIANTTNSIICEGNSVALSGSGAFNYSWTNGVINNVSFVPPTGANSYVVTGINNITGCSNSDTLLITVNALPIIMANATESVLCAGNGTTLYGSGGSNYNWTNGVIDNVALIPPTGINTYVVTGTNNSTGCSNSATINITVNPLPIVTANSSETNVCAGNNITLTGSGASSYVWSNGVINGVAILPNTTSYIVTGTNIVNGCSDSDTISINVISLPNVTANATSTVICEGESATLTGGGASSYTWSGGITDGISFIPPVGNSTYSVTGTNSITGCSNISSLIISVNPLPNVIATNNGDGLLSVSVGESYLWLNCETGVSLPSETAQTFMPTNNGSYAAIVTVNGCSDTSNCVVISNVGVDDNGIQGVELYPNPTTNAVTIKMSSSSAYIEIVDAVGKIVHKSTIFNGDTIEILEFDSGIYIFNIQIGESTTLHQIIKK